MGDRSNGLKYYRVFTKIHPSPTMWAVRSYENAKSGMYAVDFLRLFGSPTEPVKLPNACVVEEKVDVSSNIRWPF